MTRRRVAAALVAAATLAGVAGCSGPGGPSPAARAGVATAAVTPAAAASPSGAPAAEVVTTLGVTVRGAFGARPDVDIPAGTAEPASRRVDVLSPGGGATVQAGDLLVAGYHVHAWGTAAAPSHALEDTWTRGVPAIGLAGPATSAAPWADVVVGHRVGARLLVVQPPAAGRPATAVVLDLVRVVRRVPGGHAVRGRSAKGFPRVKGAPGARPTVSGLDAVGTSSEPRSRLLVAGEGPPIDARRTLVVQLVEIDLPSGRTVNSTWGGVPLLLPAAGVLERVSALDGGRVGSRAVAVLPGAGTSRARVLVMDVVAQV